MTIATEPRPAPTEPEVPEEEPTAPEPTNLTHDEDIRTYWLNRCKQLLKNTAAYEGDHGFTDHALIAWSIQKGAMLTALTSIVDAGVLNERDLGKARGAACPVAVAEREGVLDQRGTPLGSEWTAAVREAIYAFYVS
ncbi:MAG TPA: hypothetical protein VFK94_06570 [Patescibacteria group bacterium]|nr:hypothetical protein [Patescibacteria group bacterium]